MAHLRVLSSHLSSSASAVHHRRVCEGSQAELRTAAGRIENVADDPSLANPLARHNRLNTAWMGVVMEYQGVVVEETYQLHRQAWLQLAEEEGKPVPPQWRLDRTDGMKAEQVIQEVFCWTRNFTEVRRLARRKEQLYCQILGNQQPMVTLGLQALLNTLAKNQVPAALASAEPEERLRSALESLGLQDAFEAVVSAEDVSRGRPDPEAYLYAAQQLGRPPVRCVVIGNSNQSVEAARECGMAAVVVAGRRPLYELGAADLVVKELSELSVLGLKQLFRMEDLVEPQGLELQPELEPETLTGMVFH
ncbi:hypothetical protein WJX73_001934 [Symbiochloris irregularis]|uniref:Uncharacterized protein n=1 Tax=Symbiochloris irregularis TaxID=706552 RepID=A0AAW1NYU7_9CHLO